MGSTQTYDYLVIGGGLAGTLFAQQLLEHNKSFLLYDPLKKQSSSTLAAGMFNPVSGKRMTVAPNIDELLQCMTGAYRKLESELGCSLLILQTIVQAFGNTKEANDFWAAGENAAFGRFIINDVDMPPALNAPFGGFAIKGGGWVNTPLLLERFWQLLERKDLLVNDAIDYSQLNFEGGTWHYKSHEFNRVVCCEGYHYTSNPWFSSLPFKLCKGQLLLIRCEMPGPPCILKKGVYVVHLHDDVYKVGATYEWDEINELPDATGKAVLESKLREMLKVPFKVLDHLAGVRPTTRDRKAIIGAHQDQKNLYCFNGLGTKGVLLAPYLAQQLYAHIEHGHPISPDVSLNRFLTKG